MAIYKVVLNGQYSGQDIKNILYYRTGIGFDILGLTVGGTVEVAQAVRTMVWTFMKPIMPAGYRLEDITAYVYDSTTLDLIYQNPTTVQVGENGTDVGQSNGPAPCGIVKFALEPTTVFANGFKPPKRGYLAIGPMNDGWIASDGSMYLDVGRDVLWTAFCHALANNVETILPPAIFFPIRVHQDTVLGVFKITSYADIRDATLRNQSSFRRSRQPEV